MLWSCEVELEAGWLCGEPLETPGSFAGGGVWLGLLEPGAWAYTSPLTNRKATVNSQIRNFIRHLFPPWRGPTTRL